ncbi:MAG: hypothetical protein IJ905_06830 [Fibrobacter sp.]|nr:hypothetical protein [Fibrobacter sp.]
MKHANILSTAVAAFARFTTVTLSLIAISLIAATALTACGKDNTAGTDEQPNAITAKIDAAIDSASAIWFQGEKTFTVDSKTTILPPSYDIGFYPDSSAQHTSLLAGIKTEHGILRHIETAYFAFLSCETEETWFAYTVQVSSSLIQKNFTIPDTSATSIAKDFETDCILENGNFIAETEGVTEGQRSYSCKLIPTKENLVEKNALQYTDPTWEKYGKQIIGICRE